MLGRLELEVLKRLRNWGPRKVIVKIGQPLNLSDFFSMYQNDKRGVLREVTVALEASVRQILSNLTTQASQLFQSNR